MIVTIAVLTTTLSSMGPFKHHTVLWLTEDSKCYFGVDQKTPMGCYLNSGWFCMEVW